MYISIDEIIGQVANDFNPTDEDWIPRVPEWVAACLAELNVTATGTVKRKLDVNGRTAIYPCKLNRKHFKVFTKNGCEVKEFDGGCCTTCGGTDFDDDCNLYYTLGKNNKILLNFETDMICVQNDDPIVSKSDAFGCEMPMIPEVGSLIAALKLYIMWKILQRGSKHPVYNLSNNWTTNPYYMFDKMRDRVVTDVVNNEQDLNEERTGTTTLRDTFYNNTFNPRNI
jgi:hypothetical protein